MSPATLPDLRTGYVTGGAVRLRELPAGTHAVIARSALGAQRHAPAAGTAELTGLALGTYAVEARSAGGELLAEELTTVTAGPGDRPVPGFATSYRTEAVPDTLAWLRQLRCTAVQCYDWMASYTEPLGRSDDYADRLGRRHNLTAIAALTSGCADLGAVAQAYAPVYAADHDYAAAHPGQLLYRSDGGPQRLGDLLQITDPGNEDWQRHWLLAYGDAARRLGFSGFHLDTYGYPRQPVARDGQPVPMRAAYASFLTAVRAGQPDAVISFNQVNGEPPAFERPGGPGYRYIEVWPANDQWRHLEGLLLRSVRGRPEPGAVLAIYPPVWAAAVDDAQRESALRAVLLTGAVVTTLGASVLAYGDVYGCLQDPYYPDYQPLTEAERAAVLAWHRFGLRHRDLFTDGTDTSWLDIGDENGAVTVAAYGASDDTATAPIAVLPEPAGGTVCARVVRHDSCVVVSVLDLTGSTSGSWRKPAAPGRCQSVRVSVLLDLAEDWTADAAVLGQDGGRFGAVAARPGTRREGSSVEVELPMTSGWTVLRLRRESS